MRFSLNTQFGYFHNDRGQLIGHTSADVAEWLASHPAYIGGIYFNFGDGSDDMTVTEIFREEAEAEIAIERAA